MRRFLTAMSAGAAAVVLLLLGTGRPAAAIAHGDTVPAGRYAFATRLAMTGIPTNDGGSRDSWCSGALIAPRWVITAGHCFRDAGGTRVARPVAERTTATVGGGTGRAGQVANVVGVRQSSANDVALAELDRDIPGVTPLAVARSEPAAGELLRLTGYGLTSEDGEPPARLQTGTFVVASTGDTVIAVAGRSPRRDTSACLHDSGGPYFRERPGAAPELVSVVSQGPPCPHTGADEAARVDVLAGWISGQITATGMSGRSRTVVEALAGLAALITAGIVVVVIRRRPDPELPDPELRVRTAPSDAKLPAPYL